MALKHEHNWKYQAITNLLFLSEMAEKNVKANETNPQTRVDWTFHPQEEKKKIETNSIYLHIHTAAWGKFTSVFDMA